MSTEPTTDEAERIQEYSEAWKKVYRLAAKTQGHTIDSDAEIIWKSPQSRSLTEIASAPILDD